MAATTAVGNTGLYLVNGVAGNVGLPGAPILHFSFLVNATTGSVAGHANITQAIAPPNGDIAINNITGSIRSTGLGKYTEIVNITGSALVSVPPPAIGSYLVPFNASFAIDNEWDGTGGWTFGHQQISNVPVQAT